MAPVPARLSIPEHGDAVEPDYLRELAAATVAIVVGTWDDQGLVFCQPR